MKKRITIIALIVTIIAAAGVGSAAYFLWGGAARAINTTELSMGEKYLADLNYEKATATLQHAIAVEPNNMEAYLALAKAYRCMGDLDTARETLENGYKATTSIVIERELHELTTIHEVAANQSSGGEAAVVKIAGHSYRADITELVLRECGLSNADMQQLSKFTKLERLDISGNGISDISAVASLTGLKKFYAANNEISDISPLANLQSIEYVGLRGNQITNADALTAHTGLKYLHLANNRITAVKSIGGSLQLLYLAGNQMNDTAAVTGAGLLYYDVRDNPGM